MTARVLYSRVHQQGFTLIEILLVLVILALSSVAVITTLPSGSDDRAKQQAQALYQRILLVGEEAILSGRDFGLYVDDTNARYQFLKLTSDGWQPLELPRLARNETDSTAQLPDDLTLSFAVGGDAWQQEDRLFKPGSLFDEEMFAEFEDKKRYPTPQLLLLSSGEATPFQLGIYPKGSTTDETEWRLQMSESHQLKLLSPQELEQ
ncbi:type II secretion system minor pseudopilin GspH [Vibrio maerlii]|uniref:type II secretion system minor pseudopilin GspH n=1 Tax=Vibrio maerlii TaxID=2231648 RepID=UPI000E3CC336|nr:type II secretion system minor pseudopilin GspH [Vibrio maerlii]